MEIFTSGQLTDAGEYFYAKSFEDLLYDSVNLLYSAYDISREDDNNDLERALSRGSMLSVLLLFECAANCCVDALHLKRQFAHDVDKLPVLSKFELFLSQVSDTPFDRGCEVVQHVSELRSLRDKYVHPKVKRLHPQEPAPGHFAAEPENTPLLGIPYDPHAWWREVALTSARCASEFFNQYFKVWYGFDSNTVCSVLMDNKASEIPSKASFSIDMVGGLDRASTEFGLDFGYLGKGT